MRQSFPDGSVWVRTEPIGFLAADRHADWHAHAWHQLTYALFGHLEVETAEARALVPSDRAVWIPAGLRHREAMYAPVTVRTLYVAPGAIASATVTRTLAVSPLLRELIAHVSPIGALDRDTPTHAHLADVLVDLIDAAPEVSLQLPTPRDPRARRLVELVRADPAHRASIASLSRRAGASVRTLERLFVTETGLSVGEWRRRFRLLRSLRLLDAGMTVAEVADAVGYRTPSAFTAAFSRHFGVPPTRRRAGKLATALG